MANPKYINQAVNPSPVPIKYNGGDGHFWMQNVGPSVVYLTLAPASTAPTMNFIDCYQLNVGDSIPIYVGSFEDTDCWWVVSGDPSNFGRVHLVER